MKKILILLIIFNVQCSMLNLARADGEKLVQDGTVWVNPVEFFSLRELNRTDYTRAYDQGDIDFNRVLMDAGLKVYGLKLRPIAIAAHIDGELPIGQRVDWDLTETYDYQDIMGIRGAPLNEPSFCIYADGSINRSYSGLYNNKSHVHYTTNHYYDANNEHVLEDDNWLEEEKIEIQIQGLCIVPTEDGLGLSYAMTASEQHRTIRNLDEGRAIDDHFRGSWNSSKEAGVNPVLGHFIYHHGSSHLLVMLGADLMEVYQQVQAKDYFGRYIKSPDAHQMEMLTRPWPRVYFEVEEILIQDGETPVIDDETRRGLESVLDGLLTWLSGNGDPLGLGKHTDAKTGAVLNTIGVIISLLTGGVAGASGAGGSIVGHLTNPTPAGDTPPPAPDQNMLKRKEDEDEEDTPPPPPEPDDPNKFNPSDYPYGDQFLHQNPDGDIVMKSPVSGKDEHYYSNGDGTWFTESGTIYTKDDIGARLRYEAENAGTLKQDYNTAQTNLQKHQEDWEKQSKTLSKDGEDYVKWKQAQDAAEKRQDELNKLALKHNVANPTEENIKKAIEWEQKRAMDVLEWATNRDVKLSTIICGLEIVDKSAEVGVYALGSAFGPGAASKIKNIYTFTRDVAKATSEAIAYNKGAGHVVMGAIRGGVSVYQHGNAANPLKWIGSEAAFGGLKAGVNGGNVLEGAASAGLKKTLALGISKGAGGAVNWLTGGKSTFNLPEGKIDVSKLAGTGTSKFVMTIGFDKDFDDAAKNFENAANNYKNLHS